MRLPADTAADRRAAPAPKLVQPFTVQQSGSNGDKRVRFVGRYEAPELRRPKPVGTWDVQSGKAAVQSTTSLEVFVAFSDATVSGRLAAMDLLIETEHGPDSSGYLVTWDAKLAQEAGAALQEFYTHMSAQRVDFAATVLAGPLGGIVLARDEAEAIAFVNDYAPEHLQILSREPFRYLEAIRNAGEILLGDHTPSTLANFVCGPSHVLPTGGWAKTGSALSVHDFLKRTSLVHVTPRGYATLAPHAKAFADYEGFDAHGNAVSALRPPLLGN